MKERKPELSLGALSFHLRHPETWPEDFQWDYSYCPTCTMGLAGRLFPELRLKGEIGDIDTLQAYFKIPYAVIWEFFATPVPGKGLRAVTPEMVADRIDDFL